MTAPHLFINRFLIAIFTLFLPLVCLSALPLGLIDTAEILGENKVRALGETQYSIGDQESGMNFRGRVAVNVQEDSDLQGEVGLGGDTFFLAGFWKWVPFPDTVNQPAVGARMGFFYGKRSRQTFYGIQFSPTLSKVISAGSLGQIIPFAGLPIALENTTDSTTLIFKGTVGIEYTHTALSNIHFLVEYGQPILNGDYHLSLALSYDL